MGFHGPTGEEAMKRLKFGEQQIAFILRQAEEGTGVEEVSWKAGIAVQTFDRWRKTYGGLMPSEMKRLKQLEEENQRLERRVADLSLDKEVLEEVVRTKLCHRRGGGNWSTRPGRYGR